MENLSIGILSGVAAAFMSSCSYLGGAYFLDKAGNARQLLAATLLLTGVIAWILAPFFWAGDKIWSWRMLGYVAMAAGGTCFGHFSLFLAQKSIEASRIASLQGMKIFIVMFFSLILTRAHYTLCQYVAVAGTVFAAMLMNWEKGRLNWHGMGALTLALLFYAVSDVGIQLTVQEIDAPNPIQGGMQGFVLINGFLGFLAPLGLWAFKVRPAMLPPALPQTLCWTLSMWGLYTCFGLLGATFGCMLQASRGMISLVLGLALSCFGLTGVEKRHPWTTWVRRAIAAVLMFGAIALFAFSANK